MKLFVIFLWMLPSFAFSQGAYKCKTERGYVFQERQCDGTGRYSDDPTVKQLRVAPLSPEEEAVKVETLKQVVLSRLKDPGSAQFSGLRLSKSGLALCGEVNAKNSYGGYTGAKLFVADDEGVYFHGDGSMPSSITNPNARRTYYPKAAKYGCINIP